jgi:uncharacterized protein
MKLSKERIRNLAASLVGQLEARGHLEVTGGREGIVQVLDDAITDELSIEDRLNAEVRALMKQYDSEIERGGADYQKMFTMIKSKLVRERGLIL